MSQPKTQKIDVDEVIPPGGIPQDKKQVMREAAEKLGAGHPVSKLISYLLDECITIPGTKFKIGLDPILGLFPGVGDTLSAFIGTFIVGEAYRKGVPAGHQVKMALNIFLNAAVGAVPGFGDVFSAWFRSNSRNYDILMESLPEGQAPRKPRSKWLMVLLMLALLGVTVCIFIGVWTLLVAGFTAIKGMLGG